MTTRNISLNPFVLEVRRGRTREPLNILGEKPLVKLASTDTEGAVAIFRPTVPPLVGPPVHRHAFEDEWFCVLDGQITVEVDGERSVLEEEGSVAPREEVIWWFIGSQLYERERKEREDNNENANTQYSR